MTYAILKVSQLKLLLMKLYSYIILIQTCKNINLSISNINYDINNQHCSYLLVNFSQFIASNLIKMNGKVCIIRRYLCLDIKKPMSCHIMELYVMTCCMSQLLWHPYYRQQFRNSRKEVLQTFKEFTREKEVQFDQWCVSKEVTHDFNKLRQLISLEEFKSCISAHTKTYLDERNAESLHQAAVLAEDYSLTLKGTCSKDSQSGAGSKGNHNGGASGSASGKSSNDTCQLDGSRSSKYNVPVCFYCKKKGHVMAEC